MLKFLPIRFPTLFSFLAIVLVLSACATQTAAPPLPTNTPQPTFTATPVGQTAADNQQPATQNAAPVAAVTPPPVEAPAENPQPTPTTAPVQPVPEQPTATSAPPTPAATNTSAAAEVVTNGPVNVRGGPGTNYNIIGSATAGQRFLVTGRNAAGDWWQINYNGQTGWLFGQLVTAQNTQTVQVAQNIPAPPPPTNPPPPPPTNTPVPVAVAPPPTQPPVAVAPPPTAPPPTAPPPPQPTTPPAPAQGNFKFKMAEGKCEPNAGQTYMNGFARNLNNNLRNGVCVHLAFYGPRTTKCSGCDGVGDGNWGFSPFSGPAPAGTTVEIFVVQCPSNLPLGGQNEGFGDLTPQSPKWTHTFNSSEQCTGITFYGND